jgi:hypothetical protein
MMMKWNKYPETKPVEGSALTAGGCLIYLKLPNPVIDSDVTPGFGWAIRLAHFWKGKWYMYQQGDPVPLSGALEACIAHYLYLNDIPVPLEEISSHTEEYLK